MTQYLALLRGVNVGGRNRVPMKELAATMEGSGHRDVASYLQSGNVLFESSMTDITALASEVKELIRQQFETATPVVIRTAAQLEDAAKRNPFLADERDFKLLHLMFLDREPEPAAVDALDHLRSPGDRFSVDGAEIYLHLPNGAARTTLTIDYFERQLGVIATGRNWNTVSKLRAMMANREEP